MLIKNVFKSGNLNNLRDEISSICSSEVTVTDVGPSPEHHINITFTQYTYAELKSIASAISEILKKYKTRNVFVSFCLLGEDKVTLSDTDNRAVTSIELYETLKSRLPSARNLHVSALNVSYRMRNVDYIPKSVLATASIYEEHFLDEVSDFTICVDTGEFSDLCYEFTWLDNDNITETVINTVKYMEMVEFLESTPHPLIDKFVFNFRDSNKGSVSELNLVFNSDVVSKSVRASTLASVRKKLRDKFMNLPLY